MLNVVAGMRISHPGLPCLNELRAEHKRRVRLFCSSFIYFRAASGQNYHNTWWRMLCLPCLSLVSPIPSIVCVIVVDVFSELADEVAANESMRYRCVWLEFMLCADTLLLVEFAFSVEPSDVAFDATLLWPDALPLVQELLLLLLLLVLPLFSDMTFSRDSASRGVV